MDAISLYNKPGMFGGDKEKAVERLQEAIRQFEDERSTAASGDSLAPHWGHADAYVWLGIAHMKADRPDAARTAFQNALNVRPNYAWVTEVLMPKL
jgi:GH35 family endo-1,4-beta-xylanase